MMSTKGHDRLNINTQHVPLRQNAEEKEREKVLIFVYYESLKRELKTKNYIWISVR